MVCESAESRAMDRARSHARGTFGDPRAPLGAPHAHCAGIQILSRWDAEASLASTAGALRT